MAGASVLIVVVVGLQVWATVGSRDDWPFASNSMFAFYRTSDGEVYDLAILVRADGVWEPLDAVEDLGASNGEAFRRMFFGRYYGSSNPRFPQRSTSVDERRAFEARMTDFCEAVADAAGERGKRVDALAVRIRRLGRADSEWEILDDRLVGGCDPVRSAFVPGAA